MRKTFDCEGRLTKLLTGLVWIFFLSMRCARVEMFRMDDVDVSNSELECINWWIASC